MTRQDIERDYDVENGIIRSLGRFEGEAIYVPYFWEVYLDGFASDDDGQHIMFEVTDEDREQFPELVGRKWVTLYESETGFVCES